MEKLSCRSKARLVAYFQALIVGTSLGVVILLGIFLCMGPFPNHDTLISKQLKGLGLVVSEKLNDFREEVQWLTGVNLAWHVNQHLVVFGVPVPTYICWIAYTTFAFVTGVQLGILCCLSKATEKGTSPKKALRCAITWRNVTAGFLTLGIIMYFFSLFALLKTTGSLNHLCLLIFFSNIVDFGVTLICYSVVCKFIDELELQMQSPVCIEI